MLLKDSYDLPETNYAIEKLTDANVPIPAIPAIPALSP